MEVIKSFRPLARYSRLDVAGVAHVAFEGAAEATNAVIVVDAGIVYREDRRDAMRIVHGIISPVRH